jgi:glycosyltransferase involved in cell wall biosynthesis
MSVGARRILIFTTAYKPFVGGSEIAIEEVIRRLPDVFFDIITPKYRSGLAEMECSANYCIHRVGFGWIGDKFLFPVLGFLKTKKLEKNHHFDFYHVFQASYAGGAAWLLKLFGGKPELLLTIQEGKELNKQNWFIRFSRWLIIKRANRISVISEYLKNYVLTIKKKAVVKLIPNGVDVENFSHSFSYGELSELKDSLGILPGEKTIISVSRLVAKNGIVDLIAATAILIKKLHNQSIKLLLVGEGEQRNELARLAGAFGISNNVIFAGNVSHKDLPGYLKISDVFARPSLSEGMGNAFLEAMAAEVPIIGTPIGGIPDFLKDKQTGLFCRPNDPEDLAEVINVALNNADIKNRLIKNAWMLVAEKYNWHKIAIQYRIFYQMQ